MPADRTKTTLSIALIVFAMLAFVLGVTTYVFSSKQAKDAKFASQAADSKAEAERKLGVETEEKTRIRDVLGTDKETADQIEAERTELFETNFADFPDDQRSYGKLVEWLAKTVAAKDDQLKDAEQRARALTAEKEAAVKRADEAEQATQAARTRFEDSIKAEQTDFQARREAAEKAMQDLQQRQQDALGNAEQMRAITEELQKLGPALSPGWRAKFEAQPGDPDATPPWPERVRYVLRELEERQRRIQELNATLARLRVADEKLQELVREATPSNDRIDGFDGRIVTVDAASRSVLILCPSTRGLRPGLMLSVFDPAESRPELASRKAVVEVVDVESGTLARARVRGDSTVDLILPGDGVATSLWAPGEPAEVALVGFVRFGPDGRGDARALRALVERLGARVVDTVSPQTTLVVDAGPPRIADASGEPVTGWKKSDETLRKRALDRARETGIRVTGLAGLLDMLGIDAGDLAVDSRL
jgi:hypothetical protein